MEHFSSLLPEKEDLPYEEDIIQNPYSFKSWWRYIQSKEASEPKRRFWLYERALHEIPGSYKLWYNYLVERVSALEGLPIIHVHYTQVTSTFERALSFMHKMPRIWQLYLKFLVEHRQLITLARKTFDRALASLPITQHDHIWPAYIAFVKQPHIPAETTMRVYRRYLKIEPDQAEDYIDFLVAANQAGEAANLLCNLINDDYFVSKQGHTKHDMWMRLCDIASKHPDKVTLRVENIIRSALGKFSHEVGKLWVALADYYARLGHFEKAHDIFEEAIQTVITVRDFGIIWDAYLEFEYTIIAGQMQRLEAPSDVANEENGEKKKKKKKSGLNSLAIQAEKDSLEMRLARYEDLLSRQPILISDVILRQNPHNTHEWHRRISLFDDQPKLQVAEFTSALATVDPMKASGKPHTIWIRFARFWEDHGQINDARKVFAKAVQVKFKRVEHLAAVWAAYVEMELRAADESEGDCKDEQNRARSLIQQATAVPPNYKLIERQIKAERRQGSSASEMPNSVSVQDRLFKQIKLWSLYADIEESFGTFASTKAIYEKIYELRIATPLTVLNYAAFLEEHHHYEDSYRAFERGLDIFPFPHALDLWVTYLTKFVERNGASKVERARDLFEQAVEKVPPEHAQILYLMYAEFEEKYGMARHTMYVYDRAARAVLDSQKAGIFNIYVRKAAVFFGITRTREVFERAIETVPDKEVRGFCMRYARLERRLGEFDRARSIYTHCAQFCDPRADTAFWQAWKEFEEQHGNTETFKEMLRLRRSVMAQYNTTINVAQTTKLLQQAKALAEQDEMAKLEKAHDREMQVDEEPKNLKPTFQASSTSTVSSENQKSNVVHNEDEIDLDDMEESEEEEPAVQLKAVPDAVFGGLKAAASDSSNQDITEAGSKKRKRE